MEWTADVAAGDWIRERIDEPWRGTMQDFVPRGFAAYARVFHRPSVTSLPRGRMLPADEWNALPDTERQTRIDRMVHEPTTWSEAAAAFGTRLHAQAQWNRVVRAHDLERGWQQSIAPDGREFDAPEEGRIDAESLAAIAHHLAAHTTTPDDGRVALWEGWGGLVGFFGETPARTFFTFATEGTPRPDDTLHDVAEAALLDRHNAMLGRSIHDPFNNVFRKPTWQPGILSDDISKGARLELPGRSHVLFRGGVAELADPDWVLRVPWRDRDAEAHGFAPDAASPSLIWPTDRAWVLATEVDHDSTIVGGAADLIRALCADRRLEALPIREGADLTWDSDEVNR